MDDRHERIKFSIKGPEGVYHGEAVGQDLTEDAVFQVRLSNGDSFDLQAEPDNEAARYNWVSYTKEQFTSLAPVVGSIIERYFRRKNEAA
jgi:hypothetical protein